MTEILGIDISKWQSELSDSTVANMVQAGIQFAYVKASQGAASQDVRFEHNVMVLQASGVLVGAYHFVTNDNASQQYDNFLAQLSKFPVWGLPPALDCEAYTSGGMDGLAYSLRELQTFWQANDEFVRELIECEGVFKYAISPDGKTVGVYDTSALSYPSQAIVDAMGIKLTAWMDTQPSLEDYAFPSIYTNQSSGNKIFTSATMSRYLLWIANWNSPGKPPLVAPNKPAVWKDTPHYVWQYAVQDGNDFGDPGTQYDRDRWGPLLPFPGTPEPPPPDEDTIEVTIKQNGKVYAGTLEAK